MDGPRLVTLALCCAVLGTWSLGCGGDDPRVGDGRIIDALKLERAGKGFTIDGAPFCAVSERLLNSEDEVGKAEEADKLDLVVTDPAGEFGVVGEAPFLRDCKDQAKRGLRRIAKAP